MSDLRELYQQVILDHNKSPRNFKRLDHPSHTAEGFNPLCGDRLNLDLKTEHGKITDISFEGSGCAISKASASMMTDSVKGKTVEEAHRIFEKFHAMLSHPAGEPFDTEGLGKLAVFAGVSEFPARVKCAILAWHTLKEALNNSGQTAVTE